MTLADSPQYCASFSLNPQAKAMRDRHLDEWRSILYYTGWCHLDYGQRSDPGFMLTSSKKDDSSFGARTVLCYAMLMEDPKPEALENLMKAILCAVRSTTKAHEQDGVKLHHQVSWAMPLLLLIDFTE